MFWNVFLEKEGKKWNQRKYNKCLKVFRKSKLKYKNKHGGKSWLAPTFHKESKTEWIIIICCTSPPMESKFLEMTLEFQFQIPSELLGSFLFHWLWFTLVLSNHYPLYNHIPPTTKYTVIMASCCTIKNIISYNFK